MNILQTFHFLRPEFLLLMPFILLAAWLLFHSSQEKSEWLQWIDKSLLEPLLTKPGKNKKFLFNPFALTLYLFFGCVALAGPSWEQIPQTVIKRNNGLVILFDLSPSMLVQDVKPSRLIAARHKVFDLLKNRKEGYTALIAYSGDAHVVSPLSDDSQTIINLLNSLDPTIMPVYGSNTEHAFKLAIELFKNSGYNTGDILLVTDEVSPKAASTIGKQMAQMPHSLSIIGVGTPDGGPIPQHNGTFIRNSTGEIIVSKFNRSNLLNFAQKSNAFYSDLQIDDSDIKHLLEDSFDFQDNILQSKREFDQWKDFGAVLSLLLLPLILATFRRGAFISLSAIYLIALSEQGIAFEWDQLWLNENQRGFKAYQKGDYENAEELFIDQQWKGSASYQNGNYQDAIDLFKQDSSSTGFYNLGNSLAKAGDLTAALTAYDKALLLDPTNKNAKTNKDIVEALLKEQQQQDSNPQSGQQSSEQPQEQNNSQPNSNSTQQDKQQSQQSPKNQQAMQQQDESSQTQEFSENAQEMSSKNQQENSTEPEEKHANKQDEQKADNLAKPQKQAVDDQSENNSSDKNSSLYESLSLDEQQDQQALEQWLRTVPDDPSGLLRNKFNYYYQKRRMENQRGQTAQHLNDEQRW